MPVAPGHKQLCLVHSGQAHSQVMQAYAGKQMLRHCLLGVTSFPLSSDPFPYFVLCIAPCVALTWQLCLSASLCGFEQHAWFMFFLQAMVTDEQTMQLLELHKYERARCAPISDEVYRANANMLLHDENCIRLQFVDRQEEQQPHEATLVRDGRLSAPPPELSNGSRLLIQLLEPDKTEQQPFGMDPVFCDYIK